MARRLPSLKRSALVVAGLVAAYLLLGWLILPPVLQAQAEKFFAEKTGHRLTMDRPQFNPFELSLRLANLHLVQPGGEPLLAFRELLVDLSAASIFRGTFVFDGIRLDGLEATVVLLPNGRLNWSALIDALRRKDEKPDSPPPRLDIHRLVLTDATLDFADKRITPTFVARVDPLHLELTDLSTLLNEKGQYKLSARTTSGAHLAWQGAINLEPLTLQGSLSLTDVDLSRLLPYLPQGLPITPTTGLAGISTDYRLGYAGGRLAMNLEHIAAQLKGVRLQYAQRPGSAVVIDAIEAKDGRFDLAKNIFALAALSITGSSFEAQMAKGSAAKLLELPSLVVEDSRVDLAARQATLGRVALNGGSVRATRGASGRIDIVDALQAVLPAAPAKVAPRGKIAATAGEASWRYRVAKLDLAGFSAAFRDEAIRPAADLGLEDIALSLQGISEDRKAAIPLRVSFKFRDGGRFESEGKVVPAGPSAEASIKVTELSLKPAQPYLSAVARLKLAAGSLSSEGRASYGAKGAGYRGSFALRDLRLTEAGTEELILAWKSLASRAFDVTPTKLDIGELGVDGLDTQLIIAKDKSLSIARILSPTDAVPGQVEKPPATPRADAATPAFHVNIDRLRFSRGELDFADYSLALPFATRIHHLQGVVTGLSSQPGAPGQVELDGQVDDYGVARAVGQIDLFNPTDFMDLQVVFRNIEMTRLTPYSGTFAGRKIDSGKLSLDLQYNIHQRQLQGENKVVMDKLTLGDRVDSPDARSLPLDLAIAILQDADGRIELGLPVSGSLDDPQFSYGGIVWKAIVNVLTKIVTAPFRALGALLGGGEKSESIAFEVGEARLMPPEREKLVRLASVLNKRPGLSLALHGVYAETDRVALQDRQLRRSVAEKSGQQIEGDNDPGPLSTRQPKVQAALEALFSEQFGGAELAALKEGFRQANPGQLQESTSARVMSRLSGLLRETRTINAQEVTQMQGADFYAMLFDRLRNKVVVGDERLLVLAKARGEAAARALQAAGAPAQRVAILAAEKVEAAGPTVAVKLGLEAAAKSALLPTAGATAN